MMPAIVRRPEDYRAFRIGEGDTNYMVCIVDPVADTEAEIGFTAVVEIYERGGRTPPNTHGRAHELFFVLAGRCLAYCDGAETPLGPGDSIIIQPGTEHVIENTGDGKLYTLTVMVPDEDFAELIHNGTPVPLDDEDMAVLRRVGA